MSVIELMSYASDYPTTRIGETIHMEEGTDFEEYYFGGCYISQVPSWLRAKPVKNFSITDGVLEIRI